MAAAKKSGAKKRTNATKASAASKKDGAATRRPRVSQKRFIRNLTGLEFRLRLERQEYPKRPVTLQPRGMRGDIAPLTKDDLSDPILLDNLALGACEVITEAEAQEAIAKQGINIQAPHPALAALRNELGEEYEEGAVKVTEAFEDQGQVVAQLDDGQVVFDHQGIKRSDPTAIDNADANKESPIRNTAINPAEQPLPGGVAGAQGGHVDPAEAADAAARQKGAQGPAAGLGGIQRVVVTPPKKAE